MSGSTDQTQRVETDDWVHSNEQDEQNRRARYQQRLQVGHYPDEPSEEQQEATIEETTTDAPASAEDIEEVSSEPVLEDKGEASATEDEVTVAIKPRGALDTGDPSLFLPSPDSEESEADSAEICAIIDELKGKLEVLSYIAFAAPQFGYHKRLIVMYSAGDFTPGGEPIPFQAWLNPQWSPEPLTPHVLAWERYANSPEYSFLVSSYQSIRVAGLYRGPDDTTFRTVANVKMEGWRARAMQALIPYLDGYPPQCRALHPAFTITFESRLRKWSSLAPFRLRSLSFKELPVLDMRSDLRKQVEPKICEVWQGRARSGHPPTPIDIVGFIRVEGPTEKEERIVDGATEALGELLDAALDRPQAMIERPSGEEALVRLFRMDRFPRKIDLASTTMVVVKSPPVVGSGGSMEAHDPSLSSSGGNIMICSPADENGGTGESPLDNTFSQHSGARSGESAAASGDQSKSPQPYPSMGHLICFPDRETYKEASRALLGVPVPYCIFSGYRILVTNAHVEALERQEVQFEYMSEATSGRRGSDERDETNGKT